MPLKYACIFVLKKSRLLKVNSHKVKTESIAQNSQMYIWLVDSIRSVVLEVIMC